MPAPILAATGVAAAYRATQSLAGDAGGISLLPFNAP